MSRIDLIKYAEEEEGKRTNNNNIECIRGKPLKKDSLQMTQEEYDEQLKSYGREIVVKLMIVYISTAKQEDIKIPTG